MEQPDWKWWVEGGYHFMEEFMQLMHDQNEQDEKGNWPQPIKINIRHAGRLPRAEAEKLAPIFACFGPGWKLDWDGDYLFLTHKYNASE